MSLFLLSSLSCFPFQKAFSPLFQMSNYFLFYAGFVPNLLRRTWGNIAALKWTGLMRPESGGSCMFAYVAKSKEFLIAWYLMKKLILQMCNCSVGLA